MTIREAFIRLDNVKGDDENYHLEFDSLIEERLMELDPKFMTAMMKAYEKSGMARWYA